MSACWPSVYSEPEQNNTTGRASERVGRTSPFHFSFLESGEVARASTSPVAGKATLYKCKSWGLYVLVCVCVSICQCVCGPSPSVTLACSLSQHSASAPVSVARLASACLQDTIRTSVCACVRACQCVCRRDLTLCVSVPVSHSHSVCVCVPFCGRELLLHLRGRILSPSYAIRYFSLCE